MADQSVVQVSRLLDERGLSSFQIKLIIWSFFIVADRRLRHRRDRLRRAAVWCANGALKPRRARPGVQREPDRHPVRLGDLRLGRRPLRPQGGADLVEPAVRRLHPGGRLFDQPRPDVLAAAVGRPRHRRRHSQRRRDQRRIRAAAAARDARASSRSAACRSAAPFPGFVTAALVPTHGWQILFLIGGIVPIVIALAAHDRPAGIDQVHGAARKPARQDGKARSRRSSPGYHGAGQRPLRHRGRDSSFPGFNPAYLFRDGLALITPLLWLLFALNLMGYFFLLSWTPTLDDGGQAAAGDRRRSPARMLQVGGTVGALLLCWWLQRQRFLAIAIMFVHRGAGGRLDRLCRPDLADRAAGRDVLCRLPACSASRPASTSSAR